MRHAGLVFVLLSFAPVAAQGEPPVYPEGAATPRSLTPEEAAWLASNPPVTAAAVTPPPTGPLHCAAEYEPMAAIVIAWEGSTAWRNLLASMARHITTVGAADVVVAVDTASERTSAQQALVAAGTDPARLRFVVRSTDTIWMRDYGPRYVYQGDCRVIVDHTYNRPRPNDNAFNAGLAQVVGHGLYELPLVHGGGNYHLAATGRARTTRLINNENPSLTEAEIHGTWQAYQNVDTEFYPPLPRAVDSTQHIDMWMQVVADQAVVISDWPFNVGSVQDQICDAAAASMALEGYTVHRVPARSVGGVHYTYTNVVLCNDLVLIPSYTQSSVVQHNPQALLAWQAALPAKTVVQLNCQAIVTAAGVMHCIVMHVPAPRGGALPTAYLIGPNGGEVLQPGSAFEVRWVSDDDQRVAGVDLLLSLDGGRTYPTTLASNLAPSGGFAWTVPDLCTGAARIRAVARDEQGQVGSDDSDADFGVAGSGCSPLVTVYGAGSPGQRGVPLLGASPPRLGQPLSLSLGNAWPGGPGVAVLGAARAGVPVLGATLLVQPAATLPLAVDPSGQALLVVSLPASSALAGQSLLWQAWVGNDPGAPAGWAASAGVDTRLGY